MFHRTINVSAKAQMKTYLKLTVTSNVLSVRNFQIQGNILLQNSLNLSPRHPMLSSTFGISPMAIASVLYIAMTIPSQGDVSQTSLCLTEIHPMVTFWSLRHNYTFTNETTPRRDFENLIRLIPMLIVLPNLFLQYILLDETLSEVFHQCNFHIWWNSC